jgi:endonuclease YncB( thermonuclease family)
MVLALVLIAWPLLAQAGALSGSVIGVIDGDTISVMLNGNPTRVRLNGIDCPESHQPFGARAKQFTSTLSFGKTVTLEDKGVDRYRRMIVDVMLPNGSCLNRELVKAGLAWWYRKYTPSDWLLKELEAGARQAGRGLWADPHSVPPWEFR